MVTKTFTASLDAFRDKTVKNMRYVATAAIQDVLEAAQTPQLGITKGAAGFEVGKIPVAESTLINSLTVEGGGTGADAYVVAIAGMQIGDKLSFAWTAEHALPMEAGFTAANGTQVPGRQFVGANAARFPEFVRQRAAEVR